MNTATAGHFADFALLRTCLARATACRVLRAPMTLARYPDLETTTKETYNGPWNRWMRTYIPTNNASSIPPNSFLTSDPYARKWVGLMSEDHDVWVHGYWGFDWADKYVKVTNITSYNAVHTLITYSSEKAYDSLRHVVLWDTLRRAGVGETTIA
eukprot:PhF_6_TR35403/c0_g2_i6/m.51499